MRSMLRWPTPTLTDAWVVGLSSSSILSRRKKGSTCVREPSDSAEAAGAILSRVGGRWALAGALAALRYRATPRLTVDADLLAESVDGMVEAFREAGYEVHASADQGEEPHLLTVRGHGDQIDILLAVTDYQRVALDRAVAGVLAVEDVIVHKLIAWRPRDRNDIASILETGIPMDSGYIDHWAAEWDVADRWTQARSAR